MNRANAIKLAFALCMITTAVNLQAPLYEALAARDGLGVGATTLAFACYVAGIMPILLGLNGLAERVGCKPLIIIALLLCLVATSLTLIVPGLVALGAARFLLGIGTALTSAVAPTYMHKLLNRGGSSMATKYVATSTALGFGLGAAVTSLFIFHTPSVTPPSLWLYLGAGVVALVAVSTLKNTAPNPNKRAMLRLPSYPAGTLGYGLAILFAWATVGLVIAILPSVLHSHGLTAWSGFATFGICSCGVLFQPWARALTPTHATVLGLVILPLAYGLIAWGAVQGMLVAVLVGAVAASSACYGFIYLGGLNGVLKIAEASPTQASAGYFLMAYVGFSLPVITTGALIDAVGHTVALIVFGLALLIGAIATISLLLISQAKVPWKQLGCSSLERGHF
ncbi:MFS transporter [Vreelandella nanhaiensis]|uniref:MFS transporter n=1 Tax=Vreelandella nanhaiensis TaxID=1258546 RepID=A0A3S0W8K1_9GAMM|nr:MFS transporter [Halomonas nanhaiensis]RUR34697.1 MFS transporter [Halomonas nanhaiensis]